METHTKYERARLIGARALQLSMGAPINIKLSEKDLEKINYSTLEIAKLEYEKNAIPIEVKRVIPKEKTIKLMEEARIKAEEQAKKKAIELGKEPESSEDEPSEEAPAEQE